MLSFLDILSLDLLVAGSFALAEGHRGSSYDGDLTRFVTRPDIKAPLYKIDRKASSGIVPGYWFLAPYANIYQEVPPENYNQPCSTGPHIYDENGDLVWSSACQTRNQNACDFRLHIDEHGNERLSVLFVGREDSYTSRATIMDDSYTALQIFDSPEEEGRINMHELNIVDQGRSAICLTGKLEKTDIRELGIDNMTVGSVSKPGIREVEIASGKISLNGGLVLKSQFSRARLNLIWSSCLRKLREDGTEGNCLLSGRFADTIYKIDGRSGEILWRLGGRQSSFRLDGFNFSKQHDARFINSDGPIEIISFFDNAKALHPGMNVPASSNISSALVVELNNESKVARVLRRITRPDENLTELRGNFQLLPNDNAFVSWAGNGYISEHSPDGELLLEAKWVTERFVTYRAYKYNFTAQPSEPPILKAFTYGESPELRIDALQTRDSIGELFLPMSIELAPSRCG